MKISIKNPSPIGPNLTKWGDYHFGMSLQRSLEECGQEVVQHFWPEWSRDEEEGVVLVLRGKRRFQPPANKFTVLWVYSHPSTISIDEVNSYDLVFVASEKHQRLLQNVTTTPIKVLRQCTDTKLFFRESELDPVQDRHGMIFVANSRGIRRNVIHWAIETGAHPSIIGRHWSKIGMKDWVAKEYIENHQLPALYRSSRLSLNDHWGDMIHFGYINNRVFDCLACGLPVLSDDFDELRDLCGDGVLYVSDTPSFKTALTEYILCYPEVMKRTLELWDRIGPEHSFDARARTVLQWVETLLPAGCRSHVGDVQALVEEPPRLKEVFEAGLGRLKASGKKDMVRLLHLFPTPSGIIFLSGIDDIDYVSGGLSRGPWHLTFDFAMSSIMEGTIDFIIMEESSPLEELGAEDQFAFLLVLARRLDAESGLLAVPSSCKDAYAPKLYGTGLSVVKALELWTLFGPPRCREC